MYRGKHEKPASGMKKYRKSGILLASIVLILALTIGTTVAFLIDMTREVENTFNPAHVDIVVDETLEDDTKSNVHINNESDIPVFIRAKVVVNWIDSEGNITKSFNDADYYWQCSGTTEKNTLVIKDGWTLIDNYYYYNSAVAVDGETGNLFDSITITRPENPKYTLRVDIISEAIQAEPVSAVQEAWDVTLPITG